jgi:pimeloyl-ACP methyl ester carboxylesterase
MVAWRGSRIISRSYGTLERTAFYVGGSYGVSDGERFMHGQMFVERLLPERRRHRVPLLLIHGGGQTAVGWLTTPDERRGWAELFAADGWVVYIVDQPARGRSPWHPAVNGPLVRLSPELLAERFTACARLGDWPEARLHTQWPGDGTPGDPIFDAFYATQVPFLEDVAEAESLFRRAGVALLEEIGPVALITHSEGGPLGWVLADACPASVHAIVAVEPSGPPFSPRRSRRLRLPATGRQALAVDSRATAGLWGITSTPLAYEPKVDSVGLHAAWEKHVVRGSLSGLPALVHLSGLPILVLTGEASYHGTPDRLTAEFLRAAGARPTECRLAEQGIHGNGHMMMLEKNNHEIAQVITDWLGHRLS